MTFLSLVSGGQLKLYDVQSSSQIVDTNMFGVCMLVVSI